jgi:phosphoribosylformimino-5-aminoimidazole carboxamide ribotide isomerase
VRDASDAEALLDAGVARVVLGTAAVADPPLVGRLAARHPGGVAVGLDARDGEVAVRGWTAGSGASVLDLVARFAGDGVGAFVVTDIGRDGTLSGPDVRGLVSVLAATDVPVVASGGVGSLDDLRALADLEAGGRGLAGAIVGTAIHDGRFSVADALAVLAAP